MQEERTATLLKALGDEKRLRILKLLLENDRCNCELSEALDAPTNLVSHHLSVLKDAGLVSAKRQPADRRWVFYSANRAVLAEAANLIRQFLD